MVFKIEKTTFLAMAENFFFLDYAKQIKKSQTSTSNGYLVRQSEELMDKLRKENFNLQLKMYFLEKKYGFGSNNFKFALTNGNDFSEILIENESLKQDLESKHELMKKALRAIELLEDQIFNEKEKFLVRTEKQNKKVEILKVNKFI